MTFTVTPTLPVVVAFVEPEMRIPLACQSPGCGLPFGHVLIQGGAVILEVQSRHNGEKHVNLLTIGTDRRTIG